MEQYIKNQIVYGLKYLPLNLLKYPVKARYSPDSVKLRENFIKGVCHPNENYDQIKEANIDWIRIDIPFPFDKEGNVRPNFLAFRERAKSYKDHGIKVMAVTPYPEDFINYGADIRTYEGEKKVREIIVYIVNELRDVLGGLQITNEMGIPRFTLPLEMNEAAKFIGVQLEAVSCIKGDLVVGYNSAGPQADLHYMMKPYFKYCDYVGVDIYMGCFAPGFMWMFDALIDYLWSFTGRPVLLQEFGYISGGKSKTPEEKLEILKKYGASSEEDAKAHIESFVEKLPETLKKYTKRLCKEDVSRYYDFLFHSDVKDHLFCELPKTTVIPGYEHTPEGQAKFYQDILARLYQKKCVCGTIIYCYQDSEHCYVCGQEDCPVETRWGLVDMDGNPKPSYYAVQREYGKIGKQVK